ncbi:MAG: hypothetical protein IIC06_00215 [Proteobacteria bacterium]|nr:hypothetical protein [Pseudomonadota bacterium]
MRWTVAAAAAGLVAVVLVQSMPAQKALAGEIGLAQATQSPQQRTPWKPAASGQVRTYLHPFRKFTIAIPPGAEIVERAETGEILIRSNEGFMINIQTKDAKPAVTISRMLERLEAKYLGQGKAWSRKLSEQLSTVAGLDAFEAQYEGGNTRVSVVIARGRKTDFVFMFFAPLDAFDKLQPKFEWVLANFEPNPADHPATAKAPPGASLTTAAAEAGAAPAKRFAEPGYGYTIQYPGDWELSKPSSTTTSFSGKQGTDAFFAIVSIQNVQPPAAKTPAQAADTALADLKSRLKREASDVTYIGEQPLTYKNGRLSLVGRQMVVTYAYNGERYRKWVLVMPRPTGTVAHIWSYTAPDKRFDAFRPIADAMLKSWTIKPEEG